MDMHVHTDFSDAKIKVDELAAEAQRRRMGACVCDHNEIRGSIALCEQRRVVTLPAIEIGSRERVEFLLYFPHPAALERYFVRDVEPYKKSRYFAMLDRSFLDLVPAAKEDGAIVALPHPYAPGWKNLDFNAKRKALLLDPEFLGNVDLIEVINHHIADGRNFKAFMLSEVLDKSVTAGSDAHRIREFGSAYLSFDAEMTAAEIFAVLGDRIKVGADRLFRFAHTMNTSRGVIFNHLKLFFGRKNQARWMLPYEAENGWDPETMPDRRGGGDRRR
jgi:predicted metal-dependent phosphoesterase TrpH